MRITGKSLNDVARKYADHLNRVLARTITNKRLVQVNAPPNAIVVSFREHGRPATAQLNTRYGPMDLFINQRFDAVRSGSEDEYSLRTLLYGYTLTPVAMREPLFRWEYVRFPALDDNGDLPQWCRHHIQGDIRIVFADDRGVERQIPLNDWHTPTGQVAIEDIIRFCIVDLGVKAKSGWEQVLEESDQTVETESLIRGDV